MAKPHKDRRAVVEQLRREQQRSERRRTIAVISACAVVALVIVGAALVPLLRQDKLAKGALTTLGGSPSSAGCKAVVKKKATGNQEHKAVGTVITYADAPPAFGPHYPTPAAFSRKYYTTADRPKVEYLVHNLEHGYTLLWYDATIARSKDQLAIVKAIASKFEGTQQTDKFIAVPWTKKDGASFPGGSHVALTHWSTQNDPSVTSKQQGVWEYCSSASGKAVSTFMKAYPYSDSPEPGAM